MSRLRIVFFGMDGAFSRAPFQALLAAGYELCAVIIPPPAGAAGNPPIRPLSPPPRLLRALPLLAEPAVPSLAGLAWQHGVPVLEVSRLAHPRTLATLTDLRCDLICVACFPRLLPPAALRVPRYGALNVHPSLLPAYRGPAPLFWIFHDGLEHAGVTVHLMEERADAGEIVAQVPLALPDGVRYSEADRRCSEAGAALLVESLAAIAAGRAERRPQPAGRARTAPIPSPADHLVTPVWSARRAFNFIRGLAEGEQPLILELGRQRFTIHEALAYDQLALPGGTHPGAQLLQVDCSPGTLTVLCTER